VQKNFFCRVKKKTAQKSALPFVVLRNKEGGMRGKKKKKERKRERRGKK
jgi:hypothetical protein